MSNLSVTLACEIYDRTWPIFEGRVKIEGCDAQLFPMPVEEGFARAFQSQDFDICELSASSYILSVSRGKSPYVAIPAFVSRVFRHSGIYVRTDRIRKPEDLRGKKVGVPEYQMTAALWIRGILADEYGVKSTDVHWRTGGLHQPGRTERIPLTPPPEFDIKPIATNETLSALLENGELDAIISARAPECFNRKAPNVGRLFPDIRAAEEGYYRKTGMFPIMHLIAIRRSLVEEHRWLAPSVFKAFLQARIIALRELHEVGTLNVMLPWLTDDVARAEAVMGKDMWPYGVPANRKDIESMLRWSVEQGLSRRPVTIEELFAPGTTEHFQLKD